MISLFWSCSLPSPQPPQSHCFSEKPEEGELRLHSVSCSSEISSPFVRRGDWILENNLQKAIIRHQNSSLTYTKGPGASIIQVGESPILLEIRAIDIPHPLEAVSDIDEASATLSFYHEGEHILSYTLHADDSRIDIDTTASFFLTPLPTSKRVGNTLYTQNREYGMRIEGEISLEEQGFIIEDLTSLHTKPWNIMFEYGNRFVELTWSNEEVHPHALLLRDDQETWFIPFLNQTFSGYIPPQATEWTLSHPSCRENWVPIDLEPTLENCNEKRIHVSSEGDRIWSYANETLIPPQGGLISFQQSEYNISAGSAYEQANISSTQNHVSLERIFPNIHLFSPLEISITPHKSISKMLGKGIENAVISTKDFISPFSLQIPPFQEHIHAQKGFVIEQDEAWLLSWPWDPIIREAGMGAVPAFSSYQSLLSYVDRQGRISVSNIPFWDLLRSESEYTHPDFIFLSDITQRWKLYEILDQQIPLRFLGPENAIQHQEIGPLPESIRNRMLFEQKHSFGNGPIIFISEQEDLWIIDAYAPSWMEVESIHLITKGGLELNSWTFNESQHLSASHPRTDDAWVLAEIRGNHWAISPILFFTED
ncbi:MAG: hypothetical protein CL916_11890 [Deltaproteobacteria bacterium]|nr:hypothetical protein [Deltaproteobacteria bacterium]